MDHTLAELKALIASDIGRSDLTSQIADAIVQAYEEVQDRQFYFNETVDFQFNTVAGTYRYGSSITDTIGGATISLTDFWNFEEIILEENGNFRKLKKCDLNYSRYDNTPSRGTPYDYSWFGQELWLYPIPNAVLEITVQGHFNLPLPADDNTAGNKWMDDGYQYLRESAKEILYQTRINNPDRLKMAMLGKAKQLGILKRKTSRKQQVTTIEGSEYE